MSSSLRPSSCIRCWKEEGGCCWLGCPSDLLNVKGCPLEGTITSRSVDARVSISLSIVVTPFPLELEKNAQDYLRNVFGLAELSFKLGAMSSFREILDVFVLLNNAQIPDENPPVC